MGLPGRVPGVLEGFKAKKTITKELDWFFGAALLNILEFSSATYRKVTHNLIIFPLALLSGSVEWFKDFEFTSTDILKTLIFFNTPHNRVEIQYPKIS